MAKRIMLLAAAVVLAVVTGCGQVDQDTYKPSGSTYGRSDGWHVDSSYNHYLMVDGTSVYTISSAGAPDASGDLTLENDEYIDNSTDDFVCVVGSGGTSDEDLCFDTDGTNVIDITSNTGVTNVDFNAIDVTTDKLSFDTTAEYIDSGAGTVCVNGSGGTNNEDLCFDVETTANEVALATNTGVTVFDSGSLDMELGGGAEALEFTAASSSVLIPDNVAAGLDIGSAGSTNTLRVISTDSSEGVTVNGTLQVLKTGATIGWAAAAAGNQACTTTCAGTGGCVFGYDIGTTALVDCASALADSCICAGPAS